MSDFDNYDFDDDDTPETGASNPLRDLRKQNKQKEKMISELQQQLQSMQASLRERSVKDVLSSKGLNPKIAAFIPKDVTSPEDVSAWVEEYADAFAPTAPQADEGAKAPVTTDPDLQAMNRIASVQQTGQPFSSDPAQIAAQIASAQDASALNMLLFGNPNGPTAV